MNINGGLNAEIDLCTDGTIDIGDMALFFPPFTGKVARAQRVDGGPSVSRADARD